MWYVYIIRSIDFPEQEYTGATANLKRRITHHNTGKSPHTAKFKPWELLWYCAFPDKYKALDFEKYLKSHSGRQKAPVTPRASRLTPPAKRSACHAARRSHSSARPVRRPSTPRRRGCRAARLWPCRA